MYLFLLVEIDELPPNDVGFVFNGGGVFFKLMFNRAIVFFFESVYFEAYEYAFYTFDNDHHGVLFSILLHLKVVYI